MPGYQGGLNDGVWSLCEPSTATRPRQEWILKLVKGTSTAVGLLTEAQCLKQVSQQHPAVFGDPLLAYPRMILSCICAGTKTHDLIVMPKAPGQRLCEVLAGKWHSGRRDELQKIIRSVGAAVGKLHRKYHQVQHADMQPSNVFWDESSSRVTFIDVGGMALRCFSPDVEHFEKSLRLLSTSYGPEFGVESIRAFHEGYASASVFRAVRRYHSR
jgi:Ser/Thr protein kinase RdoA (MazF antagonist)